MKTELLDRKDLANHRAILLEALKIALLELEDLGRRKTFRSRWPEINSTSLIIDEAIKKTN